ncbi:hypothetical protein C1C98_13950 [Pseudomonas ogarae]|uniref:Uncharacterized protein n=1 Tax=Pseudomonas ogarae (strain DSM 112162 / CECT 30235 / F113) TaxID=1114970 RepID=A0ABM6R0Z1_PSEO1|nr:hypothetical protein C1C98_13950 [Pseudomonas ogarae]
MGASLLAIAPGQSTSILTDTPPSRASSLPQVLCPLPDNNYLPGLPRCHIALAQYRGKQFSSG